MEKPVSDAKLRQRLSWIEETYPLVWQELEQELPALGDEKREVLLLYAALDCHDLPSVTFQQMLGYVRASRTAREMLPYTQVVPQGLYERYVLMPRVNNEWLDGSRGDLLEALLPRVRGKSILEAALEVNYWCYEMATYLPADDRTIAPGGMICRGQGRCGEESTLLTAALRAVGIPARQCYSPYWAHCDDNHAWVEFWAEDGWHYMGACEPEWRPDAGWFQAAASKAMMIRSRVPDLEEKSGYSVVNTTGMYGKTAFLRVQLTKNAQPVPGIAVNFQLVNYSRVQSLHTCITDGTGWAGMECGLGSLIVSACLNGVLVERLVDLRKEQEIVLKAEDGFAPEKEERDCRWVLCPPKESIPQPLEKCAEHEKRYAACDRIRKERLASYRQMESHWLRRARGNWKEVEAFLALHQYPWEDKVLLLETLQDKDFCDCTRETLESFLAAALPYKEKYPLQIWQWQILAPRVEWEMLLPIRPEIQRMLESFHLKTREDVRRWMESHLWAMEEFGLTDRRGNAAGYIRHGCCPKSEWELVAVQIARALGIPASLSPVTGKFLDPGPNAELTLFGRELVKEEEHFSLSRWNGQEYIPIHLGHDLEKQETDTLPVGAYSLITARRQIDGTVYANARRFLLKKPRCLELHMEPEEFQSRLIAAPMPPLPVTGLTKNAETVWAMAKKMPALVAFLDPGQEPTEHLLQEILELEEAYRENKSPVALLLGNDGDAENETLRRVVEALPESAVFRYAEECRYDIRVAAGIGDDRLPLALVLDQNGCIAYGCANYNIRSAGTLLRILEYLKKE